jgi:hypothetical protein
MSFVLLASQFCFIRLYLWPAFSKIPEMTIVKYVKMFLSWSAAQSASRFAQEQELLQSYDAKCTAALKSIVPQACIEHIHSKGLSLDEFVCSSNDIITQKFGSLHWTCNASLGSVDSQGCPMFCAFNRNVVGSSVCEICQTENTGWSCDACFATQNQVGTIRCSACKLPNIKSMCGASAVFLVCEQMYAATVAGAGAPAALNEQYQLPDNSAVEFALKASSDMLLSVKLKKPLDSSDWKQELEMQPSGTTATRRDVFRFIPCTNGKFRIQSVLNSYFIHNDQGSLKLDHTHATEFIVQPGDNQGSLKQEHATICISTSPDSFICQVDPHSVKVQQGSRADAIAQFQLIEVLPPSLVSDQAPPKNSSCQFAHVRLVDDAPEKLKQKGPLRSRPVGVISGSSKPDDWNMVRVNGFWDYPLKYLVVVDSHANLQVSLFCTISFKLYFHSS